MRPRQHTRYKPFLLAGALSVSFCLATLLLPNHLKAAEAPCTHHPPSWQLIIKALNINEEQKSGLQKLLYNHERSAIDRDFGLQKNRLELTRLLDQEPPNEVQILALVDAIGKVEVEGQKADVKLLLDLKKLLSKEQYHRLLLLREGCAYLNEHQAKPAVEKDKQQRGP